MPFNTPTPSTGGDPNKSFKDLANAGAGSSKRLEDAQKVLDRARMSQLRMEMKLIETITRSLRGLSRVSDDAISNNISKTQKYGRLLDRIIDEKQNRAAVQELVADKKHEELLKNNIKLLREMDASTGQIASWLGESKSKVRELEGDTKRFLDGFGKGLSGIFEGFKRQMGSINPILALAFAGAKAVENAFVTVNKAMVGVGQQFGVPSVSGVGNVGYGLRTGLGVVGQTGTSARDIRSTFAELRQLGYSAERVSEVMTSLAVGGVAAGSVSGVARLTLGAERTRGLRNADELFTKLFVRGTTSTTALMGAFDGLQKAADNSKLSFQGFTDYSTELWDATYRLGLSFRDSTDIVKTFGDELYSGEIKIGDLVSSLSGFIGMGLGKIYGVTELARMKGITPPTGAAGPFGTYGQYMQGVAGGELGGKALGETIQFRYDLAIAYAKDFIRSEVSPGEKGYETALFGGAMEFAQKTTLFQGLDTVGLAKMFKALGAGKMEEAKGIFAGSFESAEAKRLGELLTQGADIRSATATFQERIMDALGSNFWRVQIVAGDKLELPPGAEPTTRPGAKAYAEAARRLKEAKTPEEVAEAQIVYDNMKEVFQRVKEAGGVRGGVTDAFDLPPLLFLDEFGKHLWKSLKEVGGEVKSFDPKTSAVINVGDVNLVFDKNTTIEDAADAAGKTVTQEIIEKAATAPISN